VRKTRLHYSVIGASRAEINNIAFKVCR